MSWKNWIYQIWTAPESGTLTIQFLFINHLLTQDMDGILHRQNNTLILVKNCVTISEFQEHWYVLEEVL